MEPLRQLMLEVQDWNGVISTDRRRTRRGHHGEENYGYDNADQNGDKPLFPKHIANQKNRREPFVWLRQRCIKNRLILMPSDTSTNVHDDGKNKKMMAFMSN